MAAHRTEETGGAGIGIIGASGGFGRFVASAIAQSDRAYLAAVGGSNPQRLAQAAHDLGAPAAYLSVDELVADARVSAVVVCTPPSLHAAQGIAAARAGKAVFMEKPVATTLEDARALAQAVEQHGVACVVDYVMRYNSLFAVLKEWTEAELFGRLRRIDFQNFAGDEGLPADHWFWDRGRSGGILIEHGVHFFDIYLAGAAPRVVRGLLTARQDGTASSESGRPVVQEDKVLAEVLYANGVLGSYYHAFDKPSRLERTEALLAYDRGYVAVEGWIAMSLRLDALVDEATYARLAAVPGLALTTTDEYAGQERAARGHGYAMQVTRRVRGELRHTASKEDVYRDQVRAALDDLVAAMADPAHRPRATLADGIASLEVAVRATEDGRQFTGA
jgi:predicted dehydrogenase